MSARMSPLGMVLHFLTVCYNSKRRGAGHACGTITKEVVCAFSSMAAFLTDALNRPDSCNQLTYNGSD
ncbi:hypothetical protein TNCV_1916081 [Trichonephila clavipes]|uniref:Uncharacterized protein n=1 Tax=Trichonephila clavipes TaxID=2585209 RepID=A0A8X6W0F5_TRICX|nr:hypothetical protein TNCV_1916081 [Trichonephila clavipes]